MENHEKWMDLCALAAKEQDPAKLQALTREISRQLEEKEQRVKGQLPVRKEKRWQPERRTGIQICGNRKVNPFCQIEYVSSDSDVGMPCGKHAVANCSDCGTAICSDCQMECCGQPFCELCYDYHVTHSCVRKPVQSVRPDFKARFHIEE